MAEIVINFSKNTLLNFRDNLFTAFVIIVGGFVSLFLCVGLGLFMLNTCFKLISYTFSNGFGYLDFFIILITLGKMSTFSVLLHINEYVRIKFLNQPVCKYPTHEGFNILTFVYGVATIVCMIGAAWTHDTSDDPHFCFGVTFIVFTAVSIIADIIYMAENSEYVVINKEFLNPSTEETK